MTDNARRSTARSLTTGDIVILTIVTTVFLCAAVLGGAVLWNELNPIKWTAGGWAAVGAWVAGTATFAAVLVALRQSRDAAERAEDAIAHEVWRADIVTARLVLDEMSSLVGEMHKSATTIAGYQNAWTEAMSGSTAPPDEDDMFWRSWWTEFAALRVTEADLRTAVEIAGISIRTPELRTALDEALSIIELIEGQLRVWRGDVRNQDQLSQIKAEARDLVDLSNFNDDDLQEKVLAECARVARRTMLDAVATSRSAALRSSTVKDGATITQ